MRKGAAALKRTLPELLGSSDERLTPVLRTSWPSSSSASTSWCSGREHYDRHIAQLCKQDPRCQRLLKIEGIGPLSATALAAAIGNGHEFKNGRHFSAYLGLVPGHTNTGDKTVMLGITKRGNRYLRTLFDPWWTLSGIRRPPPPHPRSSLAQSATTDQLPQRRGRRAGQQECASGVGDAAVRRGLLSGAVPSPGTPPPRAPLGQRKDAGRRRAERPPSRSEQRAFFRPALSSDEGRNEKSFSRNRHN